MKRVELANKLVGIAKLMSGEAPESTKYAVLRDLREAQVIVAAATGRVVKGAAVSPRVTIDKLPGFAPMQLRQAINEIVNKRQELTKLRTQFESVLNQISGLEADEKKGLDALKAAAAQVKAKEKYLVEAEAGLLEFTAFLQDKRPGVEQMLADPATSKFGDKAGDFFGRVGAKLGKQVQDAIAEIYRETEDDLTHTADAIRGLKVIERTASVRSESLKKAGIADAVVSIKDWLAGKVDSLSRRILNFAGDVGKWVKGFVERTKLVKKSTDNLTSALDAAKKSIVTALA